MRALPKGRWLCLLAILVVLPFSLSGPYQTAFAQDSKQDSEPKVKVVKYDDLGKAIRQLRGKVVVVDFWATT